MIDQRQHSPQGVAFISSPRCLSVSAMHLLTFERLMERVLSGLPWEECLLFFDDIIVHATTFEAELEHLRSVSTRLREAGLKLSQKKCHLFKKQVVFLGHVVSEEGVSTDLEKINAVCEWPTPTSASALHSLLGLCSYYCRFIRGFANVAAPLHRLTEKDKAFMWTNECMLRSIGLNKPCPRHQW